MRAVIQRVSQAKVKVNSEIVGEIKKGLLVFLGIEENDNNEDVEWLSAKISNLRVFSDENDAMNLSVNDINGEILIVSQFTLHALTKKGNRPSFIKAAKPYKAMPIYEEFINEIELNINKPVQKGVFGAKMDIELINDGPVTILIDTKNKE